MTQIDTIQKAIDIGSRQLTLMQMEASNKAALVEILERVESMSELLVLVFCALVFTCLMVIGGIIFK